MSTRDRNRFIPFRGILTGKVNSNSRVDYFLHELHDRWLSATPALSPSARFTSESLEQKLASTESFDNKSFIDTMQGGDLCTGLDKALSFEFLMFLSDVSAHLRQINKGTDANKTAMRDAVTAILKLPSARNSANPVSKGFLLRVVNMMCVSITSDDKGKIDSTTTDLENFKGNCTDFELRTMPVIAKNFASLFGAWSNNVKAEVGDLDVSGMAKPDQEALLGKVYTVSPAGAIQDTESSIVSTSAADVLAGAPLTAYDGTTDISASNYPSKMRTSDTHPALFWEQNGLWKTSSFVKGKINCDLKKHYVATIALAGGVRKDANTVDNDEQNKRASVPHFPLITSEEFPDPVIHVTSSSFDGGNLATRLQWTSSLEKTHQVYLVMTRSTDVASMNNVNEASNKKWTGVDVLNGLKNHSNQWWHPSLEPVRNDSNTNYPEQFNFPAVFTKLAANDGNQGEDNKDLIIGDHKVKYIDTNIKKKINELIAFYEAKKSVTAAYKSDCVDNESSISMFSTNINKVVQHMLKHGAILPDLSHVTSGSSSLDADYDWSHKLNDEGKLVDSEGNEASVDNYTNMGKLTAGNNCFTLGKAPAADIGKCANFMMGCLHGENIAECKNFMMDPNFWEIAADEVDAMLPEIGHKVLNRFNFRKSDDKYESVDEWISNLAETSAKLGGLTPAEVTTISSNVKLTEWLKLVVSKMNSVPNTVVSAEDALSSSWLVRVAGIPVKQASITAPITPLDKLVRFIHQRREALRVHLFGAGLPIAVGLVGGGSDNSWELMAHNARQEVYSSIDMLESTFNMMRDALKAKGKEIDPADLQEIKGHFKAQRDATRKLTKYIEYMEKFAVLLEMYSVQDPTGAVLGKDGLKLLLEKNQDKFNANVKAEDTNIEIVRKVQDLLNKLK